MSRFAEGDGFDSERDEKEFDRDLALAYQSALNDLPGFLAYLDAMPAKRIIASRFMDPKTGEKCAVAAFCDFKGVPKLSLLKTEGRSFAERHENSYTRTVNGTAVLEMGSEESGGWEGATVTAGEKAGLPHLVAYNLAFNNDEVWDTVQERDPVPCDARCEMVETKFGIKRQREHRDGSCFTGHIIYRPMTPEERWRKLRDHVAYRIEQAAKPVPDLGPDCERCGSYIEPGAVYKCNLCPATTLCDSCFDDHACKAVSDCAHAAYDPLGKCRMCGRPKATAE